MEVITNSLIALVFIVWTVAWAALIFFAFGADNVATRWRLTAGIAGLLLLSVGLGLVSSGG